MKLLILDIETTSLDVEEAEIKYIGLYDYQTKKYELLPYKKEDTRKIQKTLNGYDYIITFNGEQYDLPILKRHRLFVHDYRHIDLYKVFKKKAGLLRSGGFKSYSLKNIAKYIGLKIKKGEIDYEIFKKDLWTPEEQKEIETYLTRDLELTTKLWEFLIQKFDNLKEFIPAGDAKKFKHITISSGAYCYKVICHLLKISEEYTNVEGNTPYEGAYVMDPKEETIKDEILYFDFASLYPMMYVHSNLFSSKCKCCMQEEKWHGNENFKIDGYYCAKKQGKIEELVKTLFMKRKLYKADKDSRQFALKIVLNSLYGISAKPSFKNLYNPNVASDCTALSRQSIAYAIKKFEDKMYDVVYADTDSCFVRLKSYQKKDLCMQLAEDIGIEISEQFPFPFDEFNFKLEDEIKYLQFFKGRDGTFNKKHYLYVNKHDKLTIKGLEIIQKNCSKLSVKIFEEFLKTDIIKNLNCKFEKEFIDAKVNKILEQDKTIIAKQFNIKNLKNYKSKTSIYYMIGEKYGSGEIHLIKNYKIGAGKGIKYCSVEEAKELEIIDLNLEDVYKELGAFIIGYNHNTIKERKPKQIQQKILAQKTLW